MQARAIASLADLREETAEKEKRWGDELAEAEAELRNARADADALRARLGAMEASGVSIADASATASPSRPGSPGSPSSPPLESARLSRAEAEIVRLSLALDAASSRASDAERARRNAEENAAFDRAAAESAALEVKKAIAKAEASREETEASFAREKICGRRPVDYETPWTPCV